ncbi:hypothetical protein BKA56DRAFT_82828 [Ilyonectria sp. MPI-CAGE-AT-0026]|nr:hypothetical protein BKA56DRAFT_82828 [Ilyonectria sp. MPI-CAGE-AT-0026]
MSQTWPMSNAILLSALEHVVDDDQGTVYHAQLLDKTIIRVYIRGAYLLVAIRGPAQSIAECGEQLAWLAAGLSPSLSFNHCTSTITENDYDGYLNDLYPGCKVTTFDVSLQQSNVESNLSKAPCLVRAVGNPSIVTGFPTARRPENFLGLEIDTELLLSIIKTTDDGLFWPGCGKRLAVFQQTDDVVLWHICHSTSRPCLCCMRHCSLYPRGFLSIDSLRNCRHIVDLCGDSDHLLAEGQLRPSTTEEDISTLMMENQPEHDDNDAYFKDTSLSGSSSHLRTGADSTDASFESDLFSDSGSSEAYEPLDSSDQDFPALNRVLQTLLSGFRESCQVRKRPGQSETSSGTGSETFRPLRAAISTNLSSHPCRKRQRQQSEYEGSGNEDMPPPDKRAALPQGKRRRQQLACPFWKRNPGQHRACFSKTLRRIRDVKQHLTRKHTPEFYCECCCATFDNEDSHRRHVTHVSGEVCVHDPTVVLDGISHQQHRRLSKKSDFKLTDQEQWFSVWDILFPGSQRPDSAYLDFGLSEETSSFREYCFQYGPATLDQALADEIPEVERRQHLIRICQTGYNQLFEAWYSSRDSRETSSRNGSSTTSQSGTRLPQCQPTPSSSLDNSFLTRENPALADPQSQYSVPNPDMDQTRPPCAWNDASQLPLGSMASGDFQISDQDLPNMNPNIPLQSWSGAGETSTVQFIFDPIVRSSAGLNPGDLQIDGGMDFSSFLNYAGDTNPNQ